MSRRPQNTLNQQQLGKISASLVRFSARALTGAVLIFLPSHGRGSVFLSQLTGRTSWELLTPLYPFAADCCKNFERRRLCRAAAFLCRIPL